MTALPQYRLDQMADLPLDIEKSEDGETRRFLDTCDLDGDVQNSTIGSTSRRRLGLPRGVYRRVQRLIVFSTTILFMIMLVTRSNFVLRHR